MHPYQRLRCGSAAAQWEELWRPLVQSSQHLPCLLPAHTAHLLPHAGCFQWASTAAAKIHWYHNTCCHKTLGSHLLLHAGCSQWARSAAATYQPTATQLLQDWYHTYSVGQNSCCKIDMTPTATHCMFSVSRTSGCNKTLTSHPTSTQH